MSSTFNYYDIERKINPILIQLQKLTLHNFGNIG